MYDCVLMRLRHLFCYYTRISSIFLAPVTVLKKGQIAGCLNSCHISQHARVNLVSPFFLSIEEVRDLSGRVGRNGHYIGNAQFFFTVMSNES